uniref:Prolyl 4-hydroxylase alpha subunit Fe(2+) 2OG dioxygenase domain-containing protein n=1 Tax=Candidatus Kentrum eta TaxID=2126337 RepID=A0A450UDT6_9GAMM|nr:MAG: hypothetical protein BECKH772A_GA0070896_1002216 [Candidatus Kentron sp. H]VFJ91688.1 MAG: hypothetical protein BECKH772B_GA0070898_1002016 [Candidatus Kentron sp. H]VFJ98327.1 MAG: hypothetical protein BECKH772C_GA0070978_1002016 [Candidatus Kentron sp. H]
MDSKKSPIEGRLLAALDKIDRPDTVCAGGDLPLVMPGLRVAGVGLISLPPGPEQASALIARCRQAPYGKGTQTLVDTDVRRTWEMDPDAFQLTNPKWETLLADILAHIGTEFGLADGALTAHLYKLLVYETGGFFLPHQDGEKLDGMVATLVIALPALHEGGELIVSHDGAQHRLTFPGAASGNELSYAAFYADCRHEVTPIRSGHRLCLTYNLTLAGAEAEGRRAAPTGEPAIGTMTGILKDWLGDPMREKMAVLLAHEYTRDGLTPATLKGIDRARTEVLFEAARRAECIGHLALVTLWQTGDAEYAEHSYRRRRHWDEDAHGSGEPGDYEMGEIIDETLSADHWTDREGNKVDLGEIALDASEVITRRPLQEDEPGEEEFEGYTGNAGMTLDRWYHRGAVVIWPRERHYAILCQAGMDAAIGGLRAMVATWREDSDASQGSPEQSPSNPQWRACRDFATAIMTSWEPVLSFGGWAANRRESGRADLMGLLVDLDDPALVDRCLREIMPGDAWVQVTPAFPEFCRRHGWSNLAAAITAVFDADDGKMIVRNAALLRILCLHRDTDEDRLALCRALAEQMVDLVIALDGKPVGNMPGMKDRRVVLLANLVEALGVIDADAPFARLTEHALARRDGYDLTDAHLAALFGLESWLVRRRPEPHSAIARWLRQCRSALTDIVADPPQAPDDYRRPAKLPCDCGDCLVLGRFLADPKASTARFPLAKPRRQHLHRIIDDNHCDVTHVTERQGRPFTLVCEKTTASYEAARKRHQRDEKNLRRLDALMERLGE